MTDPKDLPPDFRDLQRRAEAQIAAEAIPAEELSPAQAAPRRLGIQGYHLTRQSESPVEEKLCSLYDLLEILNCTGVQ